MKNNNDGNYNINKIFDNKYNDKTKINQSQKKNKKRKIKNLSLSKEDEDVRNDKIHFIGSDSDLKKLKAPIKYLYIEKQNKKLLLI